MFVYTYIPLFAQSFARSPTSGAAMSMTFTAPGQSVTLKKVNLCNNNAADGTSVSIYCVPGASGTNTSLTIDEPFGTAGVSYVSTWCQWINTVVGMPPAECYDSYDKNQQGRKYVDTV